MTMTPTTIRLLYGLGGLIRLIDQSAWDAEEIFGSSHRSSEAFQHHTMLSLKTEEQVFVGTEYRTTREDFIPPIAPVTSGDVMSRNTLERYRANRELDKRKQRIERLRRLKNTAAAREAYLTRKRAMLRRTLVAGRPYEKYWYLTDGQKERRKVKRKTS
jgi:hypothetical protein